MARELGAQMLTVAQHLRDSDLLSRAHSMMAEVLYSLGEVTQTRTHAERSLTLYDPMQHRFSLFLYGNDTGVTSRINVAKSLWLLGYPDQALHSLNEALALAQELAHPFNLAMTLSATTFHHRLWREERVSQERADTLVTLATEHGFTLFTAMGILHRGWAVAEQGHVEDGLAQIRQSIAALQAIGAEVWRPYALSMLAETYKKVGQVEEGLTALAEALDSIHKTGERIYEAEVYRIKGELLLMQAGKRQKK